jgi:hypothetical protein
MAREADHLELVAYEPDERLLSADLSQLPSSFGHPEDLPPSRARRRVVGVGATLTGVTLVVGIALLVFGVAEVISDAIVLAIAALVFGAVLIATHWGWVHVAELSANRIEHRRNESWHEVQRMWLAQIEPYSRWEVQTRVGEDGSITIETTRYRPVPRGERTFTFARELESREVHSGDEPGATVTERAELLRRQAAADTTESRERYEAAHDAYERTLIASDDEQHRRAALRAASQALSERINSNLRDPPLTE